MHSNRYPRQLGVWMKLMDPDRLRRRRRDRHYTQANLAALVGCTQQYISLMEKGLDTDCSELIARKIAKRLDAPLEDLFEERESLSMAARATSKGGSRKVAA